MEKMNPSVLSISKQLSRPLILKTSHLMYFSSIFVEWSLLLIKTSRMHTPLKLVFSAIWCKLNENNWITSVILSLINTQALLLQSEVGSKSSSWYFLCCTCLLNQVTLLTTPSCLTRNTQPMENDGMPKPAWNVKKITQQNILITLMVETILNYENFGQQVQAQSKRTAQVKVHL